jgi:C-terminal processing protease CtpA/Prc
MQRLFFALVLLGGLTLALPSWAAPTETQRLTTLARVWGFLKYHHPGIAQPHLNWDSALVATIPRVLAARSAQAVNDQLAGWLTALGPLPATPAPLPTSLLDRNADFAWLHQDPLLEPRLQTALLRLWHAHAFPAPHPTLSLTAGGLLEHHELADATPVLPPLAGRLLALFRYWNIIEYYYPYKYAIGTGWPTVLRTFIPRFQRATTPLAYHLLVLELAAQLHDTHAFVYGSAVLSAHLGDYYPPLELTQLEGQVVVAHVYADVSPTPLPVRAGDVVLQANGEAVSQLLTRYRPYVAASTPAAVTRDLLRFVLRGQAQDSLALTVRTPLGLVKTVRLARPLSILSLRSATYKSYFYGTNLLDTTRIWRPLPGNLGYLHLGGLQSQHIAHVLHLFQHTKGLVIDLRAYPQGNLDQLFRALQPAPAAERRLGLTQANAAFPWCRATLPALAYPGYLQWSPVASLSADPNSEGHYGGKVVVLVNEKTQSYGETLAMLFQALPGVVLMGSQTSGANGNIVRVTLPGGLETYYSGAGMYYPDGRETQRVGIVPTLPAKPTLAGLQAGRDEVLEQASAYLRAQP